MIEIVVHCGTYKTGSSSIQNAAWAARDSLRAAGWLYPQAGLARNDPGVGVRHAGLVYAYEDADAWEEMAAQLLREIEGSGCPRVLLSAEAWSRPGAWTALEALLARLRDVGRVRGIVYFRNAHDYARSVYREFTRRRGNTLPFDRYLQANAGMFDLLQVARGLQRAFAGGLQCVFYAPGMDVRGDFFARLGIGLPVEASGGWINTGEDAITTEVIRVLNHDIGLSRRDFPQPGELLGEDGLVVDARRYTEVIPEGVLSPDAGWRAEFAALCDWAASSVEALCRPTGRELSPVTVLTPLIQQRCAAWLARPRRTRMLGWCRLELLRCAEVVLADVDQCERVANGRITIGGVVVLAPGAVAGAWRLIARDASGEHAIRWAINSPRYQRQFPDNPHAVQARFRVAGLRVADGDGLEIELAGEAGERVTLFELRPGSSAASTRPDAGQAAPAVQVSQ